MKTLILLLTTLASCQSVYVGGAQTRFGHGIADEATDHQSGLDVGTLLGGEGLALDLGVRRDSGNAKMVRNEQLSVRLGARLSAPRDLAVQPYISGGVMRQWNSFETEAYDYGDATSGTYARVGILVPVGPGVGLDFAYEASDLQSSQIGGRSGLNLQNDAFVFGFSFQF